MKKSIILIPILFSLVATLFAESRVIYRNQIQTGAQVIIRDGAKVYESASTDSSVLFTAGRGEQIKVLSAPNQNFCKISYNNVTAYVLCDDISDFLSKAEYFGSEGWLATKTSSFSVSYPNKIPAKKVEKALKKMTAEEKTLFEKGYYLSKADNLKLYVASIFIKDEDLLEVEKVISKYFSDFSADETFYRSLVRKEILASSTYKNVVYNSSISLYAGDFSDEKVYSDGFDGNTLFGVTSYSPDYDDGTTVKLQMVTFGLRRKENPKLDVVLDQCTRVCVAMQDDTYKVTMPGDKKGRPNQVRFVLEGDFPEDFTMHYVDYRFYKKCNYGVINNDYATVRNIPGTKGAKVTGVVQKGTKVTICDVRGTGKVSGNTLDLWYKISETEEQYVNATSVNIFPFYMYAWDDEKREVQEFKIDDIYAMEGSKITAFSQNRYLLNLKESLHWTGPNCTVVEMFAIDFAKGIYDTDLHANYYIVSDPEVELPMDMKIGMTIEQVKQIFGDPSAGSYSGDIFYYVLGKDDEIWELRVELDQGKVKAYSILFRGLKL